MVDLIQQNKYVAYTYGEIGSGRGEEVYKIYDKHRAHRPRAAPARRSHNARPARGALALPRRGHQDGHVGQLRHIARRHGADQRRARGARRPDKEGPDGERARPRRHNDGPPDEQAAHQPRAEPRPCGRPQHKHTRPLRRDADVVRRRRRGNLQRPRLPLRHPPALRAQRARRPGEGPQDADNDAGRRDDTGRGRHNKLNRHGAERHHALQPPALDRNRSQRRRHLARRRNRDNAAGLHEVRRPRTACTAWCRRETPRTCAKASAT